MIDKGHCHETHYLFKVGGDGPLTHYATQQADNKFIEMLDDNQLLALKLRVLDAMELFQQGNIGIYF